MPAGFALYRLVRRIIVIIIQRTREKTRRVASRRDGYRDTGNFRLAAVTPPPPSPPPRCNSRDINYWNRRRRPIQPSRSPGPPGPSPLLLQSPRPRSRTSLERFRRLFHRAGSGLSSANRQPPFPPSSASFSSSEEVPRVNFAKEQPRDCARLIFNRLPRFRSRSRKRLRQPMWIGTPVPERMESVQQILFVMRTVS